MSDITINNLDKQLEKRLKQRAIVHGHSLEDEIKVILQGALYTELNTTENLTAAIEKRFANFNDFEVPEIDREPMRSIPTVESDA